MRWMKQHAEHGSYFCGGKMSSRTTPESVRSPLLGSHSRRTEVAMDTSVFFRGVLFALRERRETFVAEGVTFHAAFRAMLETALDEPSFAAAAARMLENFDPVFGVFPEATEMLLEGERDFIVALENPRLRVAQFKLDESEAREELNELPAAEGFRKLAAHLNERLST